MCRSKGGHISRLVPEWARREEQHKVRRHSAATSRPVAGCGSHAGSGMVLRGRTSPQVSVVIPTLNEAANLPLVFARLPTWIHEVVLVDGLSDDDTISVARLLRPGVRVLLVTEPGKGAALAAGFAAARGEIIVMLDADGSADPAEIAEFVRSLVAGADFAKGSRFLSDPRSGSRDITGLRCFGNAMLTRVVNTMYGTRYTDLCYGYNAFWADCLPQISVNCTGFEVETLIHLRVAQAGLVVTEVPSMEHPRVYGQSNLRVMRDGLRVLRTILVERLRSRRPRGGFDGARFVEWAEA